MCAENVCIIVCVNLTESMYIWHAIYYVFVNYFALLRVCMFCHIYVTPCLHPFMEGDVETGSRFLANYKTLVATYLGDTALGGLISADDLRTKLTGNLKLNGVTTLAATDCLRVSYMLNKLDGHHIPKTQSQGAFIGSDHRVYIFDLTALTTYLTTTYKDPPQTAQSAATFKGQRGIMMLNVTQSDGSAGSVGLWDGSKMHQITDHSKSVGTVTFWKTKGKVFSLCFSLSGCLRACSV